MDRSNRCRFPADAVIRNTLAGLTTATPGCVSGLDSCWEQGLEIDFTIGSKKLLWTITHSTPDKGDGTSAKQPCLTTQLIPTIPVSYIHANP